MKKIYRHNKGGMYVLLEIANQYVDDVDKWPLTAVYVSCETGKVYCRPFSEFKAKFERVA